MTLAMTIRSLFELAAVVLLIIGYINEKKIIAFEVKLMRAVKIHLLRRRALKHSELAAAHSPAQTRAPSGNGSEAAVIRILPPCKPSGTHRVA